MPRSPTRHSTPGRPPPARRLRVLAPELLGFAVAGSLAYAADLALFVWLRGPAGLDPFTAKSLSFLAGCTIAYTGNAVGTYRARTRPAPPPYGGPGPRTPTPLRRYTLFLAVSLAGALVQLACLGLSHHVLGLTSATADTVSGAGVGMALATCLRFWGTRTLVFRHASDIPVQMVSKADEG
ncbi:membrane protein [Streptomyces chrestomyceticus JCM 4735]|uniref:Membrane protein n=1 Tax=Streptomyces chrestomyceticus JCM 4735 TaxID=1306181 RepID=A0A7U9KVJ4_9ACTN|nr:GtrA family protein [Streptomyces chrestomyceticus]GCD35358.1 membrane protein [Streptomyces chrestomyceticus JCM 4735]